MSHQERIEELKKAIKANKIAHLIFVKKEEGKSDKFDIFPKRNRRNLEGLGWKVYVEAPKPKPVAAKVVKPKAAKKKAAPKAKDTVDNEGAKDAGDDITVKPIVPIVPVDNSKSTPPENKK